MEAPPSQNLFIGDLPPTVDDEQLQGIFAPYGEIKSFRVLPPSVRGNGNAIITFNTMEEAMWIVNNLNGNIPQGLSTPITAAYKQDRGGKDGGKGKDSWGKGDDWGGSKGGDGWSGGKGDKGGDAWSGGKGGDSWGGKGGGNPWAPSGGKGKAPSEPSETVFIGDLPFDINEGTLVSIFGAYGTLKSQKILQPGTTGAAAIISFGSVDEATWLVHNLDGNIPVGLQQPIKVKFKGTSRAQFDKGKGGDGFDGAMEVWQGGGGGGYGDSWDQGGKGKGFKSGGKGPPTDPSQTVFVGDLPHGFDDDKLTTIFGAYGQIASFKILPPNNSGSAAIISFADQEQAKWLVDNLNGNIPAGLDTPVRVNFKSPSKGKGKGDDSWGFGGKDGGGKDGGKGWGPY